MTGTSGAWFLGGYRKGMAGTLGESLDLAMLDNVGWALRSWKYELLYNGFRGEIVLDSPVLGDAADRQIRAFQAHAGLREDGVIGPATGRALLTRRGIDTARDFGASSGDVLGILAHESSFDIGAIGVEDNGDRGVTQAHCFPEGPSLSQAIRPAPALRRLASHLTEMRLEYDADTAVVSWNVGSGAAGWWHDQGKPTSGSPSWWPYSDLGARCTAYLTAVRSQN